MAFIVKDCLFCVSLKTGSVVIGYVNLIASVFMVLIMFFYLCVIWASIGENLTFDDDSRVLILILCLMLAAAFFNMIFSSVLLIGIYENRPGYVKYYLAFASFMIGISCIMFISGLGKEITLTAAVKFLTNVVLQLYFLLVIRSHYLKMQNEVKRGPPILNRP